MNTASGSSSDASPLDCLRLQRSHVLFVLSQPQTGQEAAFRQWYQSIYHRGVLDSPGVLNAKHYEQHEVDVSRGKYPRLPFHYLALYELSVDGAEAAEGVIDRVTLLHRDQAAAQAPATWLYYPVVEKVGRFSVTCPPMLTVAFANAVPGQEAEFREWYATRHIRHAMNVPALVSGQCYERTQFQKPGAMPVKFHTIALYEQVGTPESMIESFTSLPAQTLSFPMLDKSRFAESVYRSL